MGLLWAHASWHAGTTDAKGQVYRGCAHSFSTAYQIVKVAHHCDMCCRCKQEFLDVFDPRLLFSSCFYV